MEGKRERGVLVAFLLAVLVSQNLVMLANCRSLVKEFAEQKNYYSPDPHAASPPHHTSSPPRHSHKKPSCPPPPQASGDCSCGPSHGGSSGTTSPPSPGGGGGGYYSSPPPSPLVPITPTPTIPVTPTTPITPIISAPPSPPFIPLDPNAPPFNTPPYIPVDPSSPPYIPVDPSSPPFTPSIGTPIYWSNNPALIWGVFGYWATVGGLVGGVTSLPFGSNLSVKDALENTRADGYGALYREGMASLLNSAVSKNFAFTTPQVREAFVSALASEKVAADQAKTFKLANEGKLKKH